MRAYPTTIANTTTQDLPIETRIKETGFDLDDFQPLTDSELQIVGGGSGSSGVNGL